MREKNENEVISEIGQKSEKLTLGPKLGPLNCLNTSLCFSLTQILETKPALSYCTNILLATTKKTATYLFSVRKKNHRPNISQLHPTASEKKTLNFVVNSVKKYPGSFEYCQCACK